MPTLRAQLEELTPHLDDPAVSEILVAGADRVFLTREGRSERWPVELPERRVRALAERVLRALGGRADRHEVKTGRLGDEFEIAVIGAARGEGCPVVRIERRAPSHSALAALREAGLLTAAGETALLELVASRRSIAIAAPFGAPRDRLLGALAVAWQTDRRVVALGAPDGPLAPLAHLLFPPGTPAESLLAVAPDVIVAADPSASNWTALLESGRPSLVSIEAPDGPAGLERLVALALAGDARLSRAAAEALVLSSVGAVLEVAPGRRLWLRRVLQPELRDGRVVLATRLESTPPAAEPRPETSATAHDSTSFEAAALVEALSNEIAEAEAALEASEAKSEAVPAPLERDVSHTLEVLEEHTRFASPDAELAPPPRSEPEVPAGPDTTPLPPRRRLPSERMATVTGPPRPSEVRAQIANVLDSIEEVSEDEEEAGPEALAFEEAAAVPYEQLDEELRTSSALAPPSLDPFETQEASLVPSLMDSTQAAEIGEMLSGELTADPRVLSVPAEATRAQSASAPAEDEWDEEAPSELIDRAKVRAETPDSPFDDEKTPVAPLFDKNPRATRRPRRRPRSQPGSRPSAVEDLGDPIRRADATPDRPRGGRRRQRDRS